MCVSVCADKLVWKCVCECVCVSLFADKLVWKRVSECVCVCVLLSWYVSVCC